MLLGVCCYSCMRLAVLRYKINRTSWFILLCRIRFSLAAHLFSSSQLSLISVLVLCCFPLSHTLSLILSPSLTACYNVLLLSPLQHTAVSRPSSRHSHHSFTLCCLRFLFVLRAARCSLRCCSPSQQPLSLTAAFLSAFSFLTSLSRRNGEQCCSHFCRCWRCVRPVARRSWRSVDGCGGCGGE